MSKKGVLVIITAPSGSGKTTIYKELLKRGKNFGFSVSYTTRKKRDDEVNGLDYYFIDRKDFKKKVDRDEFIEWALVHGELYGTEKRQIIECLSKREICILDVDVQGALRVMEEYKDAVTIFIEPPSIEELRRRLKKRGTESEKEIELRLTDAKNELEYKKHFKYIVINDVVKVAIQRVEEIIENERIKYDSNL